MSTYEEGLEQQKREAELKAKMRNAVEPAEARPALTLEEVEGAAEEQRAAALEGGDTEQVARHVVAHHALNYRAGKMRAALSGEVA